MFPLLQYQTRLKVKDTSDPSESVTDRSQIVLDQLLFRQETLLSENRHIPLGRASHHDGVSAACDFELLNIRKPLYIAGTPT